MVNDSFVNANPSKDIGKKKRANRSAKLKQSKLDARREQWLSQVKNKCVKEEVTGCGEFNGRAIETRKGGLCCKEKEVRGVSVEEIHSHDCDSESSSLINSPTGSVNDGGNSYDGSSSSSGSSSASSSSFGSGGCYSGSITEEEVEGGGSELGGTADDGCLDDWETVADALVSAATHDKQGPEDESDCVLKKEAIFVSDSESATEWIKDQNGHPQAEKGMSEPVGIFCRGGPNVRAWRSDDAFRPHSLPNLSKQNTFPVNSERLSWVRKNRPPCVPSSCPICYEDLDVTDSSFLPCPCGFHLCLFCHKRIFEEDGRCPGCRKPYASDVAEKETSLGSMFSRV